MTFQDETRAQAWMREAQAGDQAAYAELLALLTRVTTQFVRRRAGGVPWVDDVVQETLWSVHKARHTWDPTRPFGPWFYAIASHRMVDVFRRERRVATREFGQDDLEAPAPMAAESAGDDVNMEAVWAALASLPPRQRDIVEGLKLRDESVRGLAARHGMSETAVKVMAHRGYKRLRALLGDREGRSS